VIVHPAVERRYPARSGPPAPARRSCGTREHPLRAASSRTWPDSRASRRAGPGLQHHAPGARPDHRRPRAGDSAPR